MDASYIDLADPSHLEFDYMRWMRILLRSVRARRVLHVGGGACALARALAAEDPSGRQEVCEVDADVLALSRAHLGLRRTRGLRVRRSPRCARESANTSASTSHTSWRPEGSSAARARARAQAPPPTWSTRRARTERRRIRIQRM